MPEHVQAAGESHGLAVPAGPFGEPLRVIGRAELVAEDEVLVVVGVSGEVALEELGVPMAAQRLDRLRIERDRAPRAPRLRRPERRAAPRRDELL